MTKNDKPQRPGGKPTGARGPSGSKFSKKPGDKPAGFKGGGFKSGGFKAKADGDRSYGDKSQGDRSQGDKAAGLKPRAKSAGASADRGERPAGKSAAVKSAARPATGRSKDAARVGSAEGARVGAEEPKRISKVLARAGVASRRDIERMIMEGRVRLNGVVLETPVVNVTLSDEIEVDGQPVRGPERTRLWIYHKPAGLVTTNSDPEGRPTVFDRLPDDLPRVLSIGRLDINTEGLLLLTNDGGLARVLELPTTGWLRRYRVRAHGTIEQAQLDTLKDGIAVDGVLYGAIEATLDKVQGSNVWISMGLREGKNREIKNVLGALGLDVNRLIRVSYGPFQLGDLPEGAVQEIRGRTLRDQLGPRLIEDAKANFEAPLFDHGAPEKAEKAEPENTRWEKPVERRERLLARLDTKPRTQGRGPQGRGRDSRGDEGRDGDKPPRKPKREPLSSTRRSNVWMAPGARPVTEKGGDEGGADKPLRRDDIPRGKRFGRTADGGKSAGTRKFDPDSKGSTGFSDRRPPAGPRVLKARDDEGEWIRAENKPGDDDFGGRGRGRDGGGPRGERSPRDSGDRERPNRGFRGGGGRDGGGRDGGGERKGRSFGDKSFGDRSGGDRSGGARTGGDRPFGNRGAGKPGGNFGGEGGKPRSATQKPFGRKSDGAPGGKPFGGKPSGGKSFGGKPGGGKPGGGKPGGRSGGGGSFGGRPGGAPRGRKG
ncbi:pseudouridine synthase [Xaviernesmea oryzae]|uniref:pseudouridine synthase n=1 Tax=Xaviernesmea oryzae TaxID=464029 RepID=UPI0008D33D37|nr:pseudouridine synthase [Xaviernesmea oryzae]SEK71672.1 23S rRNA pseudouridine2605 synthase [Xaviernesmea oryzae]